MNIKCCNKKPIIELSAGEKLCSKHFTEYFENKVFKTIRQFDLIGKEENLGIALSGGKDSLTLLYLLKKLSEQNPKIKIIGIEPSSPTHRLPGMKRITGLDEEFIPKILDSSVIDDTIEVADEKAYRTAIKLARKDGIPVGPTTGAILYGALRYAKSNKGLAVVISPDDAFKYASFYKDVLAAEADGIEYEI